MERVVFDTALIPFAHDQHGCAFVVVIPRYYIVAVLKKANSRRSIEGSQGCVAVTSTNNLESALIRRKYPEMLQWTPAEGSRND